MTIVKTDTDVSNLVINELTESQYNEALLAGQINENELYFVGDVYSELTDGYHPTLFSFEWSDCLKNDIQWLRADTFSWHSGIVYEAAYNHLLTDHDLKFFAWEYDNDYYYTIGANDQPAVDSVIYTVTTRNGYNYSTPIYTVGAYDSANSTITMMDGTTTIGIANRSSSNDKGTLLLESETIGSYTIYFVKATDGHKIITIDQVNTAENIYNETGVAWYYCLDAANHRFKLPRTKFGFTGLRDTVGKYAAASLPNITGESYSTNGSGGVWGLCDQSSIIDNSSGALYLGSDVLGGYNGGTDNHGRSLNFDASRSNPIYGASDTVQPPATQMYLYFYVGSYTKAAYEQTAGITTEVLNEKADNDLNNITNTAKETIIGWGMPDLSAGVLESSQFTLPCDALVVAHGTGRGSYKDIGMIIDNEQFSIATEYGGTVSIVAPIGSVVQIYGTGTTEIKYYPLKGVQNA